MHKDMEKNVFPKTLFNNFFRTQKMLLKIEIVNITFFFSIVETFKLYKNPFKSFELSNPFIFNIQEQSEHDLLVFLFQRAIQRTNAFLPFIIT